VPVSPELGPSRFVWVYRVGGSSPVSVGRLYNPEMLDPTRILEPMRNLPPGRYAIQFGRYQHAWPVSLEDAPARESTRRMRVSGFVPL
jgi:hypothetical protein